MNFSFNVPVGHNAIGLAQFHIIEVLNDTIFSLLIKFVL